MKNEKLVTFACFVENHLIEKVWFARHVTANVQHMVESFIKNYRQVVLAWYDIHGRDKTDDEIQEQWCSENIKH